MGDLGPTELRLMQGLAQQVTAPRPELVNSEATVGELAWVWAKDFDALNQFWRHRLWFVDGRLAAWGWVYLPYRVPRSDGKFLEVKAANLIWQVHPDRPELLTEILDWYDDVAGDVDRLLTVQAADIQAGRLSWLAGASGRPEHVLRCRLSRVDPGPAADQGREVTPGPGTTRLVCGTATTSVEVMAATAVG
jgi:hypothetical protein